MEDMTSSRPYLIRAVYEWLVDNAMTPYLLVNSTLEGVVVPVQFVENGKIILNIAPQAVQMLQLGNDLIEFNARFSGKPMEVRVPVSAVQAIYSRENGRGMVFNDEMDGGAPPEPSSPSPRDKGAKTRLKVVK